MRYRSLVVLMAAVVCAGGCTSAGSVPATAPSTTARPTVTTEAPPPPTVTSTVTAATTSTGDRLGEITAIVEDLERRRLAAIHAGDVEAFTALFADTPYLDRSLAVFDLVEPGEPPSVSIDILDVLRDDDTCLAATFVATVGDPPRSGREGTTVLVPGVTGWRYAYAYEGREGWMCNGPHPLGSSS